MKPLGIIGIVLLSLVALCLLGYLITWLINNKQGTQMPSTETAGTYGPSSSTAFNTRMWSTSVSTSPLKITFPEFCPLSNYSIPTIDINKVSIALSGGGSRSFISSVGYFRALNRMGYKNKAQYVSTVSGGSWFYGLYSFCQSNPNFTDNLLLGLSAGCSSSLQVPVASNMTMDYLLNQNKTNSLYYGNIFKNKDILAYAIEALVLPGVPISDCFAYCVGKMFLEPYGLNSNVPVAVNKSHAQDIANRNVFEGYPLYLPPNISFWLCNTTILFNYAGQYPYATVPLTPLYAGIPQVINNNIGGHVVENFAFGNSDPPSSTTLSLTNSNCKPFQTLNIKKTGSVKYLRDMFSATGSGFASVLYKPEVVGSLFASLLPSDLANLVPKYNIFGSLPLKGTTSDAQCTVNLLSGGCNAPYGYDPKSCTKVAAKCYSNSTPQCTSSSQCSYSFSKLECANKNSNNSSMNCYSDPTFFNPLNCKCVSSAPYVQPTSRYLNTQKAQLSDGTFIDNIGIIPLLARGSKRIISFINTDNTQLSTMNEDCSDLLPLFGQATSNCAIYNLSLNNSQVFDSSYLPSVVEQLKSNYNLGGPTFARITLPVKANPNNGIAGGYNVDMLFVYLQKSTEFLNTLPPDVKNEIENGSKFKNFPHYKTFFQNTDLGIISLSVEQTNLLSTYADWCLNHPILKPHVVQMYT